MVSVCPAAGVQVSGVADPSLEEQEQGQQYPVPWGADPRFSVCL